MKNVTFLTSACRYCRYYQPEGRRGGCCQLLGVPVQGSWKACELSLPTFAPAWEGIQQVMIVPDEPARVPTSSLLSESNQINTQTISTQFSYPSPQSLTPNPSSR